MNNILWCILGALELIIVIFIVVYYVKIKKKRKVSEITFINRSIYALILHIVNKIFKKDYVAITNSFMREYNLFTNYLNYKFPGNWNKMFLY